MATPGAAKPKKRKKSVLKAIRQTTRRAARNRRHKVQLRRQLKLLRRALAAGNRDKATQLLQPTISLIDHSVRTGVLHKNTAARYKSRLMLRYRALGAGTAR
jgi:small subunit ribosomal protein S20